MPAGHVQEHGRWASVINSWVEAEGLELFDFNKLLGAMVGLGELNCCIISSDFIIRCVLRVLIVRCYH